MFNAAHPSAVDAVLNIAQRRCEDLGVHVEWDRYAETAYTDGHTITLPTPAQPITQDVLDLLYGQIIHECGHHLRPEVFKISKKAKPPMHVQHLYNIVEDEGMERERALAWRGDAKALSNMNDLIMRELGEVWKEKANMSESNGQDPSPLACLGLNQLARLSWNTTTDVACRSYIANLPTHARKLFDELVSEGWVDKLRATKTPLDTWNLTIDLAKRLYPDNDQEEYEQIREAGNGYDDRSIPQRDDSGSSFEDTQSNADKEQQEANCGNGASELSEGDPNGVLEDGDGLTVGWEDCVVSNHNQWERGEKGEAGRLGITWKGRTKGGAALAPTNLINVVDLSKSKADPDRRWTGWRCYLPTDEHSKQFANKIRRYIQSQARSQVRKDREWGNIDRSNLYRLGMPAVDGGNWNKKVFYDQRKHTMKDTAIHVLVDWSGSMIGRKMNFAADAAQRLVWCFDKVLNVPVQLAAFSNARSFCDIGLIKPFAAKNIQPEEIAKRFAIFYGYTSGNNDGDSVNWAYHQLLKRKESRKILIVMSDGAPAGSWNGHSDDALLLATKAIQADPRVELYGLGICDDSVSRYYKNYKVVQDVHDISPALFNLIKEGDSNGKV